MASGHFHNAEKIQNEHATLYSRYVFQSLVDCPLMLGDLPEAPQFPSHTLSALVPPETLNFRQKLGHLYEDALTHLLTASKRYDLLSSSIQIQSPSNITLGELDYLLTDTKTGNHIHLELAVKFYLAYESQRELVFPGPDARDNFHRKLQHLREHQLHLADSEEARTLLKERFGITSFDTQQIVHGIFYYHIQQPTKKLPEFASSHCRTRAWLHCRELATHLKGENKAKVIPKPLWLCEPNPEWLETLPSINLTKVNSIAQQRCTLIYSPVLDKPLFVAPDKWMKQ